MAVGKAKDAGCGRETTHGKCHCCHGNVTTQLTCSGERYEKCARCDEGYTRKWHDVKHLQRLCEQQFREELAMNSCRDSVMSDE